MLDRSIMPLRMVHLKKKKKNLTIKMAASQHFGNVSFAFLLTQSDLYPSTLWLVLTLQ